MITNFTDFEAFMKFNKWTKSFVKLTIEATKKSQEVFKEFVKEVEKLSKEMKKNCQMK